MEQTYIFPRNRGIFAESAGQLLATDKKVLAQQTVDILALEWFAQAQDLCWGDKSSCDHIEKPEDTQHVD